ASSIRDRRPSMLLFRASPLNQNLSGCSSSPSTGARAPRSALCVARRTRRFWKSSVSRSRLGCTGPCRPERGAPAPRDSECARTAQSWSSALRGVGTLNTYSALRADGRRIERPLEFLCALALPRLRRTYVACYAAMGKGDRGALAFGGGVGQKDWCDMNLGPSKRMAIVAAGVL